MRITNVSGDGLRICECCTNTRCYTVCLPNTVTCYSSNAQLYRSMCLGLNQSQGLKALMYVQTRNTIFKICPLFSDVSGF